MNRSECFRNSLGLVAGFLLCVGLVGHADAGYARSRPQPGAESGLGITVRVHDYVGLKRGTLERAESEVTRILREAGIDTAWVDCPLTAPELAQYPACLAATNLPHIDLNILPHDMATRMSMPDTTLGFTSLMQDGQRAYEASMFYDRIRQEAESTGGSLASILGHAAAHELGHLLLRSSGHSGAGIMRAKWTPDDFRLASRGQLLFTSEQAQVIRAEVATRTTMQKAKALALGPSPGISRLQK